MQTVCTLRPTFEKLFAGVKVKRMAQKIIIGHNTSYKIDLKSWLLIIRNGKKLTLNTGDSLDDDWVTSLTLTGPACLKNRKINLKYF